MSDQELVVRAQGRDASAFSALVARYEQRVYRLCHALVADPEVASDLAQSTWIKAFEAISGLRDGTRFLGWLRQIAVNQARDEFRRKAPPLVPFDRERHDVADLRAGPAEQLLADESRLQLGAALGALSQRERTLLALRYEQDLSYREIAEILSTTEGTVATWLFRAKARLRARLEQGGRR